MFVLAVRWSLIAGDVVVYEYDRLPLRANTTEAYCAEAPLDESVEAHATHLLVQLLRQSSAVETFEFDGRELMLKRRANQNFEVLHALAASSLGAVIGCEIMLMPA